MVDFSRDRTLADDPAFPATPEQVASGLTKRELMATIIMAGLAACPDIDAEAKGHNPQINVADYVAICADEWTESLITQLNATRQREESKPGG
jgi:hypothetical protein